MVEKEIRAAVYTEEMAKGMADAAARSGKTAFLHIKIAVRICQPVKTAI